MFSLVCSRPQSPWFRKSFLLWLHGGGWGGGQDADVLADLVWRSEEASEELPVVLTGW